MDMGPLLFRSILVVLLAGVLHGQRYSFKEYGQDAGLTNLDVCCLMQDSTGFLWVGTENGLFRYDGRQFRAYTKAQGLPSVQIEALHQTADGEIWAGTSQGRARQSLRRNQPGPAGVAAGRPAGEARVSPAYGGRREQRPAAGLRNCRRVPGARVVRLRGRRLSAGGRAQPDSGGV